MQELFVETFGIFSLASQWEFHTENKGIIYTLKPFMKPLLQIYIQGVEGELLCYKLEFTNVFKHLLKITTNYALDMSTCFSSSAEKKT